MRKCLLFMVLATGAAWGQNVPTPIKDATEAPLELTWSVSGHAEGMFRTDLDGGGGVSVWRAGGDTKIGLSPTDGTRLALEFAGEYSHFDFTGPTTLVPGDVEPWEDLQAFRVGATLAGQFNDTWGWVFGGMGRLAYESGADVGSALMGVGYGAIRYRFSDDFAVTLGAGIATRLEDDLRVIPVLGLEWQVNEMVRVETEGLGLRVSAQVSEQWEVALRGGYESREWRLSERRAVLADGVARDDRVLVGGEVAWKPTGSVRIAIQGGMVVWQELEALSMTGVKVGDQEGDPGAFVGVAATIKF